MLNRNLLLRFIGFFSSPPFLRFIVICLFPSVRGKITVVKFLFTFGWTTSFAISVLENLW